MSYISSWLNFGNSYVLYQLYLFAELYAIFLYYHFNVCAISSDIPV